MRAALLPLPLIALTACGDSLLSGAALEDALGLDRLPDSPGWMRAWVDEEGDGVLLSCDLEALSPLWYPDDEDDDPVYLGRAEVPAPGPQEPPIWTEGDGYDWAVSVFVLVDLERIDLDALVEALEDDGVISEIRGVWGVADEHVRLHGGGDMEALGRDLVAGQVPPDLDDGVAWMGYAPRLVMATGSFSGALTALEPDDGEALQEEGIRVRHLESLDDATLALLSGEPFGGLGLADDCDGERW